MTTTSLKLPDALKADIQAFAAEDDVSSHAFMVRTLECEVQRRRLRAEFIAEAEASLADVRAGGPVYAAEDVFDWLNARIRAHTTGEPVAEPRPIRGSLSTRRKKKAA